MLCEKTWTLSPPPCSDLRPTELRVLTLGEGQFQAEDLGRVVSASQGLYSLGGCGPGKKPYLLRRAQIQQGSLQRQDLPDNQEL